MRIFSILIIVLLFPTAVRAQENLDQFLILQTVGQLIYAEEECEFDIDSNGLKKYLESKNLLNPESLGLINSNTDLERMKNIKLTQTKCDLYRAVANKIGALKKD